MHRPSPLLFLSLLVILVTLFQTPSVFAQEEQDELIVGVHRNFPPQYSIDEKTGEPVGFAIDIMDEVAKRSGLNVRYAVFNTWPELSIALEDGRIDAIANTGIIEERKDIMDFTVPVEVFQIHIFVRSLTTDIHDIDDLNGRNVAVVVSNKGHFIMQEYGKANLVIYGSVEEAFLSLISGSTDALVYPEPVINHIAIDSGIEDHVKVVGEPLFEVKRGIAVRKGQTELLGKLDREVKVFITTPEYQVIYTKWYGKPEPYWNVDQILIFGGSLFAIIVASILGGHYFSLRRVNKELNNSIAEQNKAQIQLKESEEKFRVSFEYSGIGMGLRTPEGRWVKVNKAFCDMLGYTEPELLELDYQTITHPDDREYDERYVKDVLENTGDDYKKEKRYKCKDGMFIWVRVISSPLIKDSDGKPIFVIVHIENITELKLTEDKLLGEACMRDTLLDNLPCVAMVLKKETREIVASNEVAKKIGAFPGKTCYGTCVNRSDSCPFCLAPELWATNEPRQLEVEYEGVYYEGIWVPLTEDLYVHYIFDITERKKAESLFKLNEQRLKALLELSKMTGKTFNEIGDLLLKNCVKLTSSKYGFIGLINEDESVFTRHAVSKDVMTDCKVDDTFVEFQIDKAGIWAEAVRQRKNLIINDYLAPDSKKLGVPEGHVPLTRLISIPLFDDGKMVALASVANKEDEYDETDVTQLTLLLEGMFSLITKKNWEEEIHLHSEIMKNMTEGVYIVGLEDVIIRYTNPIFEEMFGYNSGEMIGKHASIVNAPTDKDPVETAKEIMDTIYKTGGWHGEIENIKKDGTHFWCYASVSMIDTTKYGKVLVSVHTDITERKQADENIRKSKKMFESLYSESPVGIELYDSDGCLIDVNAVCLEIFGVNDVEAIKGFKLFEDPNLSEDIMNQLKNGEHVQFESEFDFDIVKEMSLYETSKSGKIWLECNIIVMDIEDTSKIKYMLHVRDITEIKKMEELRIENQGLALADKTKSEFLSIMSHELRTPLNASIGFSELLKMGRAGELNDKQEVFVDKIITSNKHLNELIGEILDLGKIEAGKMELNIEQISLHHFIEESISILNVLAKKRNVVIKIDTAPEIDVIECDKQRLRQIIMNFVNNAIKFSKDEGGAVTITATKDGDMARISVLDTGIGIKKGEIGKLFTPFTQLDMGYSRKYGGTGLGLAITKQLVELHGGEIWVESKYREGTTFTFTLPIKVTKGVNDIDKSTGS